MRNFIDISEGKNLASIVKAKSLSDRLVKAAQTVYDNWTVDEDGYDFNVGKGGICHLIAEQFVYVLSMENIVCTTVSSDYEFHVYVVLRVEEGIFEIDLPHRTYETGGGFSWLKIPDVEFDVTDLVFAQLDRDNSEEAFVQYGGFEDF